MQERAARSYRITAVGRRGTPIIEQGEKIISCVTRESVRREEVTGKSLSPPTPTVLLTHEGTNSLNASKKTMKSQTNS